MEVVVQLEVVEVGLVVAILGVEVILDVTLDEGFFEILLLELTAVLEDGLLVVGLALVVLELDVTVVVLSVVDVSFAVVDEELDLADVGLQAGLLVETGVDDLTVDEELLVGLTEDVDADPFAVDEERPLDWHEDVDKLDEDVESKVAIEPSVEAVPASSSVPFVPLLEGSVEFISIEGGVTVEFDTFACGCSNTSILCHVPLWSVQL